MLAQRRASRVHVVPHHHHHHHHHHHLIMHSTGEPVDDKHIQII
jgi:hypothetical protein